MSTQTAGPEQVNETNTGEAKLVGRALWLSHSSFPGFILARQSLKLQWIRDLQTEFAKINSQIARLESAKPSPNVGKKLKEAQEAKARTWKELRAVKTDESSSQLFAELLGRLELITVGDKGPTIAMAEEARRTVAEIDPIEQASYASFLSDEALREIALMTDEAIEFYGSPILIERPFYGLKVLAGYMGARVVEAGGGGLPELSE